MLFAIGVAGTYKHAQAAQKADKDGAAPAAAQPEGELAFWMKREFNCVELIGASVTAVLPLRLLRFCSSGSARTARPRLTPHVCDRVSVFVQCCAAAAATRTRARTRASAPWSPSSLSVSSVLLLPASGAQCLNV